MKKLLVLLVSVLYTVNGFSQKKDVPPYEGYRSLASFKQDTVLYLRYNYGCYNGSDHEGKHLSDFFESFELPISEVEFACWTPGGIGEVGYVCFWLLPREEARRINADRYSILVESILSRSPEEHSMRYEELLPYVPNLEKNGKTIVPWKEIYKEALGSFLIESIQYVYGAY